MKRHPVWISVTATLSILACLVVAELVARRCFPDEGISKQSSAYLIYAAGPFFQSQNINGREELIQVPQGRYFPDPQRFALEKPLGLRRMVIIGESSAAMFANHLKQATSRGGLSDRLEIINMAMGGSDLEEMNRRFYEALRYSPDMIIVLFGHNLFYHHPLWISEHPAMDRVRLLLLGSRLVSSSARYLASYRRPHRQSIQFRAPGRWMAYRASLAKMADEAHRRGIRLVLCTVPGNLHFPPTASETSLREPEFLETQYLHWRGKTDSAIAKCRVLLSRKPDPWWSFQLGEWLYQAGRYAQAREYLIAARDSDPEQSRASSAVNDLIRKTAKEKHLLLLDFEGLAARSAPHGIPGWETFEDNQHVWNADFEVAECLKEMGLQKAFHADLSEQQAVGRPLAMILDTMVSLSGLGKPSQRAASVCLTESYLSSFTAEGVSELRALRRRPEKKALLLSYIAEAFWRAGLRDQAMQLNNDGCLLAPGEKELWVQRALFHLCSGESEEAGKSLKRALTLDPDQEEARFYLAKLAAGRG